VLVNSKIHAKMDEDLEELREEIPIERLEPIGEYQEENLEENGADSTKNECTTVAKVTADEKPKLDQAALDAKEAERLHSKCSIKSPPY